MRKKRNLDADYPRIRPCGCVWHDGSDPTFPCRDAGALLASSRFAAMLAAAMPGDLLCCALLRLRGRRSIGITGARPRPLHVQGSRRRAWSTGHETHAEDWTRTPPWSIRPLRHVGGRRCAHMTARFGRSPVREAAYGLRARRRDLDLKLSWRVFTSLVDWGKRWTAEQDTFAAGLILSAAGDPVVERAVGRCMADLARLGRPLLWGVVGQPVRWQPRFTLTPNGWPPEQILPHPAAYARLVVAHDAAEFCPAFDPILFSADRDFYILGSGLRWWDVRHWPDLRHFRVVGFDD